MKAAGQGKVEQPWVDKKILTLGEDGEGVFHFVGVDAANFTRVCNPTSESGDPSVDSRSWPCTQLQIQFSKPSFEFCKASITSLFVFIFEGKKIFSYKKHSGATHS